MAGGYTHITLAQLAIEEVRYRHPGLLHDDAKNALGYWKKFCIVGAVAPDYPYLVLLDSESNNWADAMHKGNTVEFLRRGVEKLCVMKDEDIRQKCMAWLFGFASHVATDGTIHPVVNLKVGDYETHKTQHRVCEMSQDVYAHARLNMGVLECNHQISINVNDTSDMDSQSRLDPDVASLWRDLLVNVYPALPSPKIHTWHKAMRTMMSFGEKGNVLFPFARHVAANQGLVYPAIPDEQYLKGLDVPGGVILDFEEVFQKALDNIIDLWGWMALSLQEKNSPLDNLLSWSLDTGIDKNGKMVYWS